MKIVDKGLLKYGLDISKFLIRVTKEEAFKFACNVINIGNNIIMPECGERLPKLLSNIGYEVDTVNLKNFIMAGGGPHCLSNNISQMRVTNGLSQINRRY